MITFDCRRVAHALEISLRRHGLSVGVRRSNLSSSVYIEAGTDEISLRIRISSHVARPTYQVLNGSADIEVGRHQDADTANASAAAGIILRRLGMAPDARLRSTLTRQANEHAAENAQRAAATAEFHASASRHQAELNRIDAILAARGYIRDSGPDQNGVSTNLISGKKWRELRAKIRAEEAKFTLRVAQA